MREEPIKFKNTDSRRDFISIDGEMAISSEGDVFKVGDTVNHQTEGEETAVIKSFTVNKETMDVIAHTTKGAARISFLY